MRPVDRGEWPLSAETSLPIPFRDYGDAKSHLTERIGRYCSYCELPIQNQPAVEHIQPKSRRPDLERTWCNLLLSCATCNGVKGAKVVEPGSYLWPDQDNTSRAFAYTEGGLIGVNSDLPPGHLERARATLDLVGLDRVPGGPKAPTPGDQRWNDRRQAWDTACRARSRVARNDTADMRDSVVDLAVSTGFWSVWMAVFADDPDMRRRLIAVFPGTSRACFDEAGLPVLRAGGSR